MRVCLADEKSGSTDLLSRLPASNEFKGDGPMSFWLQRMMAGHKACYDCIKAFSETNFTEDLKKIDIPTLFIHGDDDQIVPFADSAPLASKLVKGSILKVYEGAPQECAQL